MTRELYGRLVEDKPRNGATRFIDWMLRRIDNGGHRQAPATDHGGAPDQSDPGDAGAGDAWTCAQYANTIIASAPSPRSGTGHTGAQGGMSGGNDDQWQQFVRDYRMKMAGAQNVQQPSAYDLYRQTMLQHYAAMVNAAAKPEPSPPLKHDIQTGEIIAWRAWKVQHGLLTSMYVDQHIWPPHEPITGDLKAKGNSSSGQLGVHGFKTQKAALEYASDAYKRPLYDAPAPFSFIVGRVYLWGEVIEHEKGYRAEYAKVHSLDVPLGVSDEEFRRLKALYGARDGE